MARPSKGAGGRVDGAGARRSRWPAVLLVLGTAVQLVPVVAFPTVLTQDGPAHVYSGWVLDSWGVGGPVGAALHSQFRIDLSPVPNMLSTFLLAGLVRVAGPDLGERLLVGGIVVALVAALWWAVRGVDRRAGWLALGALPLAGSYLVAYGFYNFCLGMVGWVLVLGLALRRRAGWSAGATGGLALLLLATWLLHLLPFALAVAGLGLLGTTRAVAAVRGGTPRWPALRRHLGPPGVALLPALALTAVYLNSAAAPGGAPGGAPSWGRIASLVSGFRPFVIGIVYEVPAAAAVAAALIALLVRALRGKGWSAWRRPDRAALGALLMAVVFVICVTPGHLGQDFGFLVDRLAWFPALLALLLAATRLPGPRFTAVVASVLVLAASAAVVARLPWEIRTSRQVQEVLSVAPDIRPGSTFVVLRYVTTAPGTNDPDPIRHASSRLAIRAQSVDVGHYEAAEPYFQLTFAGGPDLRRKLDPDLRGLEEIPPVVDLPAVRHRLDYVVVVGLDQAGPGVRNWPTTRAVQEELAAHYRRVATSQPHGLVTVWRVKGPSAGGGA